MQKCLSMGACILLKGKRKKKSLNHFFFLFLINMTVARVIEFINLSKRCICHELLECATTKTSFKPVQELKEKSPNHVIRTV